MGQFKTFRFSGQCRFSGIWSRQHLFNEFWPTFDICRTSLLITSIFRKNNPHPNVTRADSELCQLEVNQTKQGSKGVEFVAVGWHAAKGVQMPVPTSAVGQSSCFLLPRQVLTSAVKWFKAFKQYGYYGIPKPRKRLIMYASEIQIIYRDLRGYAMTSPCWTFNKGLGVISSMMIINTDLS